ncbi:hypothetical protein LTR85_011371 [Meristemomyces frigidus]|nr:hypothetical protein LTR85_011371 [Meristemomyces frigidus]
MSSSTVTDGKGPRWIGDSLPSLPPELEYAQSLPPKVTDKYVFFFGFEGPEPECCLQQWYPSVFTEKKSEGGKEEEESLEFHTAEQYMMYHKALVMGDEEIAQQTLECSTPAEAKALGRKVRNFDQNKWDASCDRIVEEGNYLKFSQDERMKRVLVGTEARGIVETSPNDRLWGVGYNSDEALEHVSEWGENKLGKALERVRERLKEPLRLN